MDTIYLQESIIESKSTTRNVISNTIRYFIAVEMSFSKGRYFRDGGGGGGGRYFRNSTVFKGKL